MGHRLQWNTCRVIDLYAGTGALGLECLSRGALHVTFVEKDRRALDILGRNVRQLAVEARSHILGMDVLRAASRVEGPRATLIVADPPYDQVETELFAQAIAAYSPLADIEAEWVIEHRTGDTCPAIPGFRRYAERVYGDTSLGFYTRIDSSAENHV